VTVLSRQRSGIEGKPGFDLRPTIVAAPGTHVLITCEHGGNRVPAPYRQLLAGNRDLLSSHRGYDPGALAMARDMARALSAPLIVSTTSRLLVDLNRSPRHPRLHSEAVRAAPAALRRDIIERCYLPYRNRAEAAVAEIVALGRRVIHISSHSFTPMLDGRVRNADVGVLYDPTRPSEAELCRAWQQALAERAPGLRVRRNYPYKGVADGLCTWLRKRFPDDVYVGVELEINQKHVLGGGAPWLDLRHAVLAALVDALHAEDAVAMSAPADP